MSLRVMAKVFDVDLAPNLKIVLLALADFADDYGGHIFPSLQRLTKKCSMSRRTVQRRMDDLEQQGFIVMEQPPRLHHPAHYHIELGRLRELEEGRQVDTPGVPPKGSEVPPEASGVSTTPHRGANADTQSVIGDPPQENGHRRTETGDDAQRVIEHWRGLYEQHRRSTPVINWPKEKSRIKPVIAQLGAARVLELLDKFFESDDEFILGSDYGIGAFLAKVNRLAANPAPRRLVMDEPWFGPNLGGER